MGAPIGVVQGAFILRKKAPALKIQTRLLAQWIGNCILQTHRLRREMPEFVEALGKAYESYEVGGEREEFPKTTPFTFNGEKFFIHAFWIRHVARAFSVYLSAQGLGATPIRCPQVAFSILKRIGGRWCILQFQTCVEGSRIGVWDRDLGVQLGRELKRWHSLDRVRLNGSLAHGRILSVSDFLHTFRELEQSPDRESIKDFDIGVIDRARFYLSDPSLIGQSALPWALHSVGLAPARQELAWATYFLLGRHADAAESLEENYFESEPEAFQGWHRCRLHWTPFVMEIFIGTIFCRKRTESWSGSTWIPWALHPHGRSWPGQPIFYSDVMRMLRRVWRRTISNRNQRHFKVGTAVVCTGA